MSSPFVEKLQVAVITATVVSAGWIMAGALFLDRAESAEIASAIEAQEEADPASAQEVADASAAAPAPDDTRQVTTQPSAQSATLIVPVTGVGRSDLVDTFSDERGEGTQLHEAIDITAEAGTPVVSVAPGRVERLFRSNTGGNTAFIRSEDGETIYYYAHLADYAPGLTEGQQVRRGQRIGSVGSTGNASADAPHLHFEVMRTSPDAEWWEPAISVNPFPLLTQ